MDAFSECSDSMSLILCFLNVSGDFRSLMGRGRRGRLPVCQINHAGKEKFIRVSFFVDDRQ